MDITIFSARDTATITLLHPVSGNPITSDKGPATVTLYGPGTAQHQAASAARQQRLMDRLATGKAGQISVEAQNKEQAAFLAACTHSISGWDYKGGTDQAAITAAYLDHGIGWIADQVGKALGSWANFLPEPLTA